MSEYKHSYLACNLNALNQEESKEHRNLLPQLGSHLQNAKELQDGFSFQFPDILLETIFRFVTLERKCCPFLDFEIEVGKEQGPIQLTIKGPAGIKEFLRMDLRFGPSFLVGVHQKMGLRPSIGEKMGEKPENSLKINENLDICKS